MVKARISFLSLLLVVYITIYGILPQTTEAADQTIVTLNAPAEVAIDEDFTVMIDVNYVTLLNAASYRVTYDAGLIALDDVTDGTIENAVIPVVGYKEVQPGVCNIINVVGGVKGITGTGNLAVLHFHTLSQTDVTYLEITEVVLSDNTATKIEATWSGTSLAVTGKTAATAVITPASGIDDSGTFISNMTVTSGDNASFVTIEAGTIGLNADGTPLTKITFTAVTDSDLQPPANYSFLGQVFDLGPNGAIFDKPATITFAYDQSQLPTDFDESDLVIACYDAANGEWVNLDSTVDIISDTVSVSVTHFTNFAILVRTTLSITTPETTIPLSSGQQIMTRYWTLAGGLIVICIVVLLIIFRKRLFGRANNKKTGNGN